MANNRTLTPGVNDGTEDTLINYHDSRTKHTNCDSRSQQEIRGVMHGTKVPGMNEGANCHNRASASGAKPIVGFLVSVSRTDEGEYWVLRQGQNLIGSDEDCSILLEETSVSGLHAVLAVHRNPNDGNKLNVGIIDKCSSNGTSVNGNYIGFNPFQCNNLDIIKIGNYELLLILFDVAEYNMKKSPEFESKVGEFDYDNRDVYGPMGATRF